MLSVCSLGTDVDMPTCVMDLTGSDKTKDMPEPAIWGAYARGTGTELGLIERFAFYERTKNAYLCLQTGEENVHGAFIMGSRSIHTGMVKYR